jgi:hypothetical protein
MSLQDNEIVNREASHRLMYYNNGQWTLSEYARLSRIDNGFI